MWITAFVGMTVAVLAAFFRGNDDFYMGLLGWGIPVLAEPLGPGVPPVAEGGWQVWPFGLLRRLDSLLHIPVMPDQTADYDSATLDWLLAPVGMVAVPAGWPSLATVG